MILRLIFTLVAEILAKLASTDKERHSFVVFPPASEGSGGDQAIMDVLLRRIRVDFDDEIVLLCYHDWERYDDFRNEYGVRLEPLSRLALRPWQFISLLRRTRFFAFIGADVVDGGYSSLNALIRFAIVHCFGRTGANSAIVSFSFSDTAAENMVAGLKALPPLVKLHVRDPVSAERVEAIVERPITRCADLAFLLVPDATGIEAVCNWAKEQKSKGQSVIGFGVNAMFMTGAAGEAYAYILKKLLDDNEELSLVFIPHDFRDGTNDIDALRTLSQSLRPTHEDRLLLIQEQFSARQLKAVAGHLDAIISGRMHFAIAGLGQGVPTFCFRYQGKFEGIFSLFGLSDWTDRLSCDRSDAPRNREDIALRISSFLAMRSEIHSLLTKKVSDIRDLSERNFFFEKPPPQSD